MEAFLLSVVMFFSPAPEVGEGAQEVAPMNTGGTVIVGDKKKN
jgi:hypothetical protein